MIHMPPALGDTFRSRLATLDRASPRFVTELVELLLAEARASSVSDIHLQPSAGSMELRWRVDGVLHSIAPLPLAVAPNIVARLKVVADLLTYRTDVPQEGRIRGQPGDIEMRVSTFPTLYGEKAVVRLFAGGGGYERLGQLGLPEEIRTALERLLGETSGALLFTGPAGSGKTTTIYACLRELVALTTGRRSLATLEDPIEVAIPGVAQSQVNLAAGFDLESGLRSLMRQDPEVIAVGEIRDRATAEVALQASLTGHLVLTTFHAGSAAGALGRLSDMGIEPYILRSGLLAVVFQRLLRRLCSCARPDDGPRARLGLPVRTVHVPVGCEACGGTGYRGRTIFAEMLLPNRGALGRAVLERLDVDRLEEAALQDGMIARWQRAAEAVEAGLTSPEEVRRVLGFGETRSSGA
jgi:type II secretory ATPase GspE/PulE/Tfp pilus assembly ATPase PilB-like protein